MCFAVSGSAYVHRTLLRIPDFKTVKVIDSCELAVIFDDSAYSH